MFDTQVGPDDPIEFKPPDCDHGVAFDKERADKEKLGVSDIRKLWPRLYGKCPKGCGFNGIAYASWAHFMYGDW